MSCVGPDVGRRGRRRRLVRTASDDVRGHEKTGRDASVLTFSCARTLHSARSWTGVPPQAAAASAAPSGSTHSLSVWSSPAVTRNTRPPTRPPPPTSGSARTPPPSPCVRRRPPRTSPPLRGVVEQPHPARPVLGRGRQVRAAGTRVDREDRVRVSVEGGAHCEARAGVEETDATAARRVPPGAGGGRRATSRTSSANPTTVWVGAMPSGRRSAREVRVSSASTVATGGAPVGAPSPRGRRAR